MSVAVSQCSGRPVQNATVTLRVSTTGKPDQFLPGLQGQSEPGLYQFLLVEPYPTVRRAVDTFCSALDSTVGEHSCRQTAVQNAGPIIGAIEAILVATDILVPELLALEIVANEFAEAYAGSEAISGVCDTIEANDAATAYTCD